MGGRYVIRTNEIRRFPLGDDPVTDYYLNNIFQVIKLVIKKRKKIIFITRHFH